MIEKPRDNRSISSDDIRRARDRFAILLERPNTKEREWQTLFSQYPYILSRALPLALSPDDIKPLATPGRTEPDFIFYPYKMTPVPFYGAVELKTPQSKILTIPRREIVTLSRTAATAVQQAFVYTQALERSLISPNDTLIVGGRSFVFVIMGLSSELARKLGSDLLKEQFAKLVPPGCQIIPYDVLLQLFSQSVPPRVFFLVPTVAMEQDYKLLKHVPEDRYHELGLADEAIIEGDAKRQGIRVLRIPIRRWKQGLEELKCPFCGTWQEWKVFSTRCVNGECSAYLVASTARRKDFVWTYALERIPNGYDGCR